MTEPRRPLDARLRVPVLALLGVNLAVFLVFTLPRTLQERSIARRAAALRAEVQRERGAVAAQRRRADTIRANLQDADRFTREVLETREATLLPALREVHAAARDADLTLGSESFAREDLKGAPVTRVTLSLPVTGSYRGVTQFLERLEAIKQFAVVDELRLGGRRGEAGLTLSLSLYFRSEAS